MSYALFDKQIYLFIHIPKTAGRSIQTVMQNRAEVIDKGFVTIPNLRTKNNNYHSTIRDVNDFLCFLKPQEVFTFTVVRNPWSRVISWYEFRKDILRRAEKNSRYGKPFGKVQRSREDVIEEYNTMCTSFKDWLFKYSDRKWDWTWFKLTTPQYSWINLENFKIDKIIKFENLNEELNTIELFKDNPLPVFNTSKRTREKWQDYYDDESKKFVEKIFEIDIDTFKYTF